MISRSVLFLLALGGLLRAQSAPTVPRIEWGPLPAEVRDPRLASACADLKGRLLILAAQANRRPVTVRTTHPRDGSELSVRLDGAGLMNCLYAGLETAGGVRETVQALDAACRGDLQALAPLLNRALSGSQGTAWGMRLAVWCNEEFPFEQAERILHPYGLPKELAAFIKTAVPIEALSTWPLGHPEPKENAPVASDVPILIASGEFDPDTPEKWSRAALRRLSHAYLLRFPGMSHAPLFTHPEAPRLMRAFFDDPSRAPSPNRLDEVPSFLLTGVNGRK